MRTDILSAEQSQALAILSEMDFIQDFYLVGGTALALQYGHRESVDFDFCTDAPFSPDRVSKVLNSKGMSQVNDKEDGTLNVIFEEVSCSFLLYEYPVLNQFVSFQQGLRLASVADLAAMKVAAIAGRGRKRDFIDLYFICKRDYPLTEVLGLFNTKYESLNQSLYHVHKSLVYFADADPDETPKMFEQDTWEEIKQFFEDEVAQIMDSKT